MHDSSARRVVGVWIDHREAVLVFLTEQDTEIMRILSNVERHPRRSGVPSSGPFEAQLVQADDSRERRHTGLLARFYDEVVACIAGTDSVLILGPGEAKGEFLGHLEKAGVSGRTVSLEAAARLSEGRLVRAVRSHFQHSIPPFPRESDAGTHARHSTARGR